MRIICLFIGCLFACTGFSQPVNFRQLDFAHIPFRWDEAIPIGNGWLGALIWQKENKVRLSLDRVDCWDDRPMPSIGNLRFNWVQEQVKKGEYDTVQKIGDEPYERYPAPTKIPCAALEFPLDRLGATAQVSLDISNGLATIRFSNGIRFNNYIHATREAGYFGWENLPAGMKTPLPELIIPAYQPEGGSHTANSVDGQSLQNLGYPRGTVQRTANSIRYHQPTWKGHYYEVLVQWKKFPGHKLIGAWTITVDKPASLPALNTSLKEPTGWDSHAAWWKNFWGRSSVSLPDSLLEKQYYLELYKFGSVARSNTPPVSLQAVWTADNGKLPPWKGDLHHDLNTQLSYWPGYSSNHIDLTAGFTNWLWKVKDANKRWTQQYFEKEGLNVPGVTTITGQPMGGWIQYSMSPTTACWLAQHFYWQWRYSGDKHFLLQRAYPYVRDIAIFMKNILCKKDGYYYLPLSSSPEYNNNSIHAWFNNWTNYDLALTRYLFTIAAELAAGAGANTESADWVAVLPQLPSFATDSTGLLLAPGTTLQHSHRHHSPYMAIYPLTLLNIRKEDDRQIIERSIYHLQEKGTRAWCGYSFSWMASIYARSRMADSAVQQLRIFASNFCSPNSFHLNGDQRGGQYSNFTYRPFTLEGNFAFAQGIHELLLQTNDGITEVFPAVPNDWQHISFHTLRSEGGFLISANKENGVVIDVTIKATTDGALKFRLPKTMVTWITEGIGRDKVQFREDKVLTIPFRKGQTVIIKNGFE